MHTLANANVSANSGVTRHKADVQYVTRMFVCLTDFNSYAKRVTRICYFIKTSIASMFLKSVMCKREVKKTPHFISICKNKRIKMKDTD